MIDWANFTPWQALFGGLLIGTAAAMLLLTNGRIAGISGILGGLFNRRRGDTGWRLSFVVGLLMSPFLYRAVGESPAIVVAAPTPLLIAAGLLVGIGTRLGSGCTSGHGVCGVSRGSPRSIAATVVFMAMGVATVYVSRHGIGP